MTGSILFPVNINSEYLTNVLTIINYNHFKDRSWLTTDSGNKFFKLLQLSISIFDNRQKLWGPTWSSHILSKLIKFWRLSIFKLGKPFSSTSHKVLCIRLFPFRYKISIPFLNYFFQANGGTRWHVQSSPIIVEWVIRKAFNN